MFSEFFIAFTNLVYKFLFWIRPQNFWLTTFTRLLFLFLVSVWFFWFVQFTYQNEICEVIWHLLLTSLLNFFARNKVQYLYENPRLLGCDTASSGKQFFIYLTVTVPSFSGFSNPRRWRHCDFLTHLELLTKWCSVTSNKTHLQTHCCANLVMHNSSRFCPMNSAQGSPISATFWQYIPCH